MCNSLLDRKMPYRCKERKEGDVQCKVKVGRWVSCVVCTVYGMSSTVMQFVVSTLIGPEMCTPRGQQRCRRCRPSSRHRPRGRRGCSRCHQPGKAWGCGSGAGGDGASCSGCFWGSPRWRTSDWWWVQCCLDQSHNATAVVLVSVGSHFLAAPCGTTGWHTLLL